MHYGTPRINFLEPAEGFLALMASVLELDSTAFETGALAGGDGATLAVVPKSP